MPIKKAHNENLVFSIHFRQHLYKQTYRIYFSDHSLHGHFTIFWLLQMLVRLLSVERIIPFQKTNQGREMADVEADDMTQNGKSMVELKKNTRHRAVCVCGMEQVILWYEHE